MSVLVLRRDPIDAPHFRTPTPLPVLGAIVAVVLVVRTLVSEEGQPIYVRAGVIVALGIVLWAINHFTGEKREMQPEELSG